MGSCYQLGNCQIKSNFANPEKRNRISTAPKLQINSIKEKDRDRDKEKDRDKENHKVIFKMQITPKQSKDSKESLIGQAPSSNQRRNTKSQSISNLEKASYQQLTSNPQEESGKNKEITEVKPESTMVSKY